MSASMFYIWNDAWNPCDQLSIVIFFRGEGLLIILRGHVYLLKIYQDMEENQIKQDGFYHT